jgi:hypothetical protein
MAFQRQPPTPPEPPILSGRVPPNDLGAEAAVISAILLDPSKLLEVRAVLADGADSFYSDQHRLLFEAMVDLADRGEPLDNITVIHWLRDRELVQRAGGAKYLGAIVDATPAVANVGEHAGIVADMRARRRLIAECQRIAAEGYGEVVESWVDVSVSEIAELTDGRLASSWNVLDADDIFAELPPIPWVVEGLEIAPGPVTMIAGYGYSKKTLSAQALAIAVAGGLPVWDRWSSRQGKVVHVDYEQGARLTRERYQRLARGMQLEASQLRGQIEVVSLPGTYLDSANAEAVFSRQLDGATLAIVDSYRAAAPTIDENSSEARMPLDMLGRVSERTGCAVIVIHHARKPQPLAGGGKKHGIRGTGALFDACQSIFVLGAEDGNDPSLATHEKARITGKLVDDFALRAVDLDGRWGLQILAEDADQLEDDRAKAETDALCNHILQVVRSNPGMATRTVTKLARRKYSSVSAALQILEADGSVQDLKVGRGGSKWHAHAQNGGTSNQ